jgi:hypothetical protein
VTEENKAADTIIVKDKKRKVLLEVKNLTKYFPVSAGLLANRVVAKQRWDALFCA